MSFQRHVMRRFTAGLMSAALVFAGTAPGAWAHDVQDDLGKGVRSLGHKATGFETKRIKGTGEGMPSVRGPFPDTVNMTFLGQVTNGDMGLKKLVFTGALRAAGDTAWVMWVSIAIHWAMAVAVVLLVRVWSVHPLVAWSTLLIMNNAHAFSVFYRYRTGLWRRIQLID